MALSMLDLGKEEAAEQLWKQALEISPDFEYAVYNQLIHQWYKGKIDDVQVMTRLKELDQNVMSKESSQAWAAASRSRGSDVFLREENYDPAVDSAEFREVLERIDAPWIYLDADSGWFSLTGSEFADKTGRHRISITDKYVQVRDQATSEVIMQMGGVAKPGMTAGAFYHDAEHTLLVWGRTWHDGQNSFMKLYDMKTGRCVRTMMPGITEEFAGEREAAYERIGEAYGLLEGEYNEELAELNRHAGQYGRICGLRGVYPAPVKEKRDNRDKPRGEYHSYFEHYFPTNAYGSGILLEIEQKAEPIRLTFYRVNDSSRVFGHGTAKENAFKNNKNNQLFSIRLKRGEKITEDIVLSPDHSTFYCRVDGQLCIIKQDGKLLRTGQTLGWLYCISPDGTQLAAGDTNELCIYSVPEGKITRKCPIDAASTGNLDWLTLFSEVQSRKGYFREDGRAVFIEIGGSLIMISLDDHKQYFIGNKETEWLIDYEYEFYH